jgi:hypothetical protein
MILAALSQQRRSTVDPVYMGLARVGATLGLVGHRHMRAVAAAAVQALGAAPSTPAVWRFAWEWWYQRSVDELIAIQADLLTPQWAAEHVRPPDRTPPAGSVLLSVHQFNLAVAAARAVQLVRDLGVVSLLDLGPGDVAAGSDGFLVPPQERMHALRRFYGRIFHQRMYPPEVAARRGLELLRRGGSLIVLPEFYGDVCGPILGRNISVATGPVWLARRAPAPIVPFLLIPSHGRRDDWRLWCGDPIEASHEAVVSALEAAVRRLPTTWAYWRGWYAAPAHSTSSVMIGTRMY